MANSIIMNSSMFTASGPEVSLDGDGGYVTAALGNTWSHSVNTRLIVQYLDGQRRQVMLFCTTVNQQILACYYIWQIWRIACFR